MFMALAGFAPSPPWLANEKSPNQRADRHQQDGAGHDEKIHPFWCHTAYGWQCPIHDVKI
jgi:hypothetical protein